MLLAIDTATHIAGIALYDQDGLHAEQTWRTMDNHSVELMPYIVHACEQQGLVPAALQAIAVSLGPGSFTGLRVGLSIAKGLALALRLPVLGIPTLDATAYAHSRESLPVCAVVPAGRGRWCIGFYGTIAGTWQRTSDYILLSTEALSTAILQPTLICGEIYPQLASLLRQAAPERAIVASPASSARRTGYLAELAWQRFLAADYDDLVSLGPIYLQQP